eukprot:TRINITY_DN2965_c0_g1_i4.p2 TRINITY_DN2965_c0_g1~~TRINITY_DN2965_c0_g1_i4.p2  ORF type:complete len:166 (-),score=12.35 TRINITY_DN2965_c0_g1_i4:102-530(-)
MAQTLVQGQVAQKPVQGQTSSQGLDNRQAISLVQKAVQGPPRLVAQHDHHTGQEKMAQILVQGLEKRQRFSLVKKPVHGPSRLVAQYRENAKDRHKAQGHMAQTLVRGQMAHKPVQGQTPSQGWDKTQKLSLVQKEVQGPPR